MNQVADPDYIGVLLGFSLGLISSVVAYGFNQWRLTQRALTLLKLEMTVVTRGLDCIHPESQVAPLDPLSNLNLVMNPEFLSVLGNLGAYAYQLHNAIIRANQAATFVLSLENKEVEDRAIRVIRTEIFTTNIKTAKECANKINHALK